MKRSVLILWLIVFILFVTTGCRDDASEKDDDAAFDGQWTGAIETPGQPLDIMVNLTRDNEWTGTISIPVQGIKDYPLSSVTVNGKEIAFFMDLQGQQLSFDGEFKGEAIEGHFSQQGQTFAFKLSKDSPMDDGNFLSVQTDEETLYGELEKPDGDGPFPVMLIIPGSGPTDRDGNASGLQGENNSLKMLAEGLADQGIASVRYDKRGVDKNLEAAIPENELDFDRFVHDARAWIELLKEAEDYSNVGIIGHSQGSLVGMMAAQESQVSVFISLAGAGRPIDEVLYEQLKTQVPDEQLQEAEHILEKLKQGKNVHDVSQDLRSVFRPSVQAFTASWMQYDPREEITELEVPVLLAGGGRDVQVPISDHESLHEANPDADMLILDKMNHVLKEAPDDEQGDLEPYSNPDLPLADGLIPGILEFLTEHNLLQKQ